MVFDRIGLYIKAHSGVSAARCTIPDTFAWTSLMEIATRSESDFTRNTKVADLLCESPRFRSHHKMFLSERKGPVVRARGC